MIYAYIVAALAIFGAGFAASHTIDKAEIVTLQASITQANTQAEAELKIAQAKVAESDAKAQQLNQQIEVSHAQAIQTANALTDRVATAGRVYASRQNCSNTVSASSSSTVAENPAAGPDFSDRLAQLVRRADDAAIYATSCWQFVTNNCGIVAHVAPAD